jgi:hypothetical protein
VDADRSGNLPGVCSVPPSRYDGVCTVGPCRCLIGKYIGEGEIDEKGHKCTTGFETLTKKNENKSDAITKLSLFILIRSKD